MLLANYSDWFAPYLTGDVETNLVKSEVVRRLRLHRMSETLVTMNNAGAHTFPWEKPFIFQSDLPPPGCCIDLPAYYSSREIKEIGLSSNKIRNSRAVGILLSDNAVYTIYNTGPYQMKNVYALMHKDGKQTLEPVLQLAACADGAVRPIDISSGFVRFLDEADSFCSLTITPQT